MKLPSIETPEGRRAFAFFAILGGCVVMTLFAAAGVYLVSGDVKLSFWLALAAHVQILVGMTAMGWAMGRRMQIDIGKDGAKLNDQGGEEP
jgi:hypothetical protein